jgi:hypothetical protein
MIEPVDAPVYILLGALITMAFLVAIWPMDRY